MRHAGVKEICWMTVLTILCIVCFPLNPLVLTGVVEPGFHLALYIMGWVAWVLGMVLVVAPIVMFPRRGGVPKGKSFAHTTRLVNTGIYAVVRHPQYLGGILSIFLATPLLHPHWLFVILGIPGVATLYLSAREEDKNLVQKFGSDYVAYMKRVPRMNLVSGAARFLHRRQVGND